MKEPGEDEEEEIYCEEPDGQFSPPPVRFPVSLTLKNASQCSDGVWTLKTRAMSALSSILIFGL